ncbi:tRNA lysidine(34) synthetase TilS [Neisseria perflava]|uniref:tRNA lysidine(34) synthetase TilS n=1 Tax=Neisseria perflava TaxID=33053 RepID=UPI00209ED922|nr:tRNA lysidine(34) synthetase TilS [Neisseria perflava]MCP1660813.1 tRNA(Ile)-lysidine synthase [Neisseria perflava]MCP1773210.1 tRNA(Ile)-lysidine synthase [Neisseria perflava]
MNLFHLIEQSFCSLANPAHIEVGLSGGLDSVVLLHLLVRLRERHDFVLTAVHVHHGLSAHADEWAVFCQRYCDDWEVPLRIVRVKIEKNGLGVEAAARAARYAAFSDGQSNILALAHHQDDQIETFMLAVLRGGGVRAMAAMPPLRNLNGKAQIWRPLLAVTRLGLAAYAQEHGLAYVEDESNRDSAYLRNWLRHEALPHMRQRVPHLDGHILANVRSAQDDLALLDEITAADYAQVCADGGFALDKWRGLSAPRRRRLLREFVVRQGAAVPSQGSIWDFERVLAQAQTGEWRLADADVFAYRNRLFLLKRNSDCSYPWAVGGGLKGRLKDVLQENGFVLQPCEAGWDGSVLITEGIIRSVDNTDSIFLGFGHKSVKKLLQESHILPFVRKKWPIITNADGECLAVANLRTSKDFRASPGVLPVYQPLSVYLGEPNPTIGV